MVAYAGLYRPFIAVEIDLAGIYLLSIYSQYVDMLVSGEKLWEFRANPDFGITERYRLQIEDVIFICAREKDACLSEIRCFCIVKDILREADYTAYFSDFTSGHWREAGCAPGTDRDLAFFKTEILDPFRCAVKLETHRLAQPIRISDIKHKYRGTSWSGKGFLPVRDLKRFQLAGQKMDEHLRQIVCREIGE